MTSENARSPVGKPVGVGVAGLGRAFMLTLPTLRADDRIALVAACDPRPEARSAFEAEFGGTGYRDIEALCSDPAVEMVYVATPHQVHAGNVAVCARHRKHVLVEKPLAVTLADGAAMVAACWDAGVHLIVGPSHSFDAPVLQARRIISGGEMGKVRMIHALNYTDFLYRPRRPEELVTEQGGGVVFSQAVHQVDVVRLLAGGLVTQVTAATGAWDPARPTEGAYGALLRFEGGAFASLTYSGYAHFDSDEWQDWIGELGHRKNPEGYGGARSALGSVTSAEAEADLKSSRTYGEAEVPPAAPGHEHFGPVVVSLDAGDLRLTPHGVWRYGDRDRRFEPAPALPAPRATVVESIVQAVRENRSPVQSGAWGLASLEVCHAILESARTTKPVDLRLQVGVP